MTIEIWVHSLCTHTNGEEKTLVATLKTILVGYTRTEYTLWQPPTGRFINLRNVCFNEKIVYSFAIQKQTGESLGELNSEIVFGNDLMEESIKLPGGADLTITVEEESKKQQLVSSRKFPIKPESNLEESLR